MSQKEAILELFADDSTLHSQAKNKCDLQKILQVSLDEINTWCQSNKMVLHPKKTKSMVISTRQKHQKESLGLTLSISSKPIEQVLEHKVLGVIIDNQMCWRSHVNYISKKLSRNLFLMKKMSFFISSEALKLFFHAHCLSHLNYISTVWCNASQVIIKKLNMLHKRGIKILTSNESLSTVDRYRTANILPLNEQFIFNAGIMVYKITNNLAPVYLSSLLKLCKFQGRFNLYQLPLPRIDLFKCSLQFWGVYEWNLFPGYCKNSKSLRAFKSTLRNYLLSKSN
jgi:uncharacterized HAD superfamily protein